ncbi:hypothetical protein BH18ACI4_BH18ACI4_18820 [soil metagenome]
MATHPVMFLRSILTVLRFLLRGAQAFALMFLFYLAAAVCLAQSIDISSPSPVRTNEIVGAIVARDLGDSRLTDHFYAFTGTPGDLLITVKGNNLNGDVDLFTAGSLRPLMKFTLYAENSSPVTRAIFLRKREDLILRVEARSPNDDQGTYHIKFGGSFAPKPGNASQADIQSPSSDSASIVVSSDKNSRRVSSVGARIAEPPRVREEVAAAPTPQPTPDDLAAPAPTTPTAEPTAKSEAPAPEPARGRAKGRVPPGRRRPASQPAKKNEQASSETPNEEKALEATNPESRAPGTRRTERRGTTSRPTEQIPAQEPQTGPRLVIEMQDGTRIERFMNTIRRVTVENNQIVVVRKDGVVDRTRMSEVLRMSIEP